MKKLIFLLLFISLSAVAFAQDTDTDKAAIKKAINTMFDGMRKPDTLAMRTVFAQGIVLQSVSTDKNGQTHLITEPISGFLSSVAKPHAQVYDEQVTFANIKIDGALASVWAPYKFYVGTTFSHCGVDVFQLVKIAGVWKITYIIDTRRKDNCPE